MRARLTAPLLALLFAFSACKSGSAPDASRSPDDVQANDCPVLAAPGRLPETPEAATALREKGTTWTNRDIRARYVCAATSIGAQNEQWKAQGLSVEERAHRAFQVRHDARVTARAMMASSAEISLLQERDKAKYGDPGGPTFDWLVKHAQEKGMTGDAVFEYIIESSQRTDADVNKALGIQ